MQPYRADGDAEGSNKAWPLPSVKADPVSFDSTALSRSPSSVFYSGPDEMALAMLALLNEMDINLHESHKAVLAGDGLGLETCTREQARLHRALEMLLWPRAWPGTAARDEAQRDPQKDAQKDARNNLLPRRPSFVRECAPHLAAELEAAECRVLHQTRIQEELLRRVR